MNEQPSQPRPAAEPSPPYSPNGYSPLVSEEPDADPLPAFARCPFLGMTWDRASSFLHPSPSHVCVAQQDARVSLARQAAVCMTASFARCAAHLAALAPSTAPPRLDADRRRSAWRRLVMLVQSLKGQEAQSKGGLATIDLFQETP